MRARLGEGLTRLGDQANQFLERLQGKHFFIIEYPDPTGQRKILRVPTSMDGRGHRYPIAEDMIFAQSNQISQPELYEVVEKIARERANKFQMPYHSLGDATIRYDGHEKERLSIILDKVPGIYYTVLSETDHKSGRPEAYRTSEKGFELEERGTFRVTPQELTQAGVTIAFV